MSLFAFSPNRINFLIVISFVSWCGPVSIVNAESSQKMVHLDGTAALFEGREFGGAELVPVYASDINFEAELLLLKDNKNPQTEVDAPESAWICARRLAVTVRLLARQAKMLGETTDEGMVSRLVGALKRRIGGAGNMSRLLARHGQSEQDLHQWAANTLLASSQIQAFVERSGMFPRRDEFLPDRDTSTFKVIPQRRIALAIASWVQNLIGSNRVRILK